MLRLHFDTEIEPVDFERDNLDAAIQFCAGALAPAEMLAPDLRHRLHYQHPRLDPQLNKPPIWPSKPQGQGVIFRRRSPRDGGQSSTPIHILGRWNSYATNGHGGNYVLKRRTRSDYQVTILEVAGSAATEQDIHDMESRWKLKLLSREMGLNKN